MTKATAKVTVTAKKSIKRGKTLSVAVRVTSANIVPGGKVKVKVGSKTKTVKLNKKGRATVKVKIAKSTKVGTKKVTVTYLGGTYVAKQKAKTSKVRVVR